MTRHAAYVLMTWETLGSLLGDHSEATSTLPMDATVDYVILDDRSRQLRVYMTSQAFAPVVEGGVIPQFDPEWERVQ